MTDDTSRLTAPDEKDEKEAGYELAEELFSLILRLSEGDLAALATEPHPDSVYAHMVSALSAIFHQLGVPSEDVKDVMDEMGDGSPPDEAIESVRREREGDTTS
jgi:hypothetical protein